MLLQVDGIEFNSQDLGSLR